MFVPNYPNSIETEQQLNIFFDYVVHGIIDTLDYPVGFYGVETQSDSHRNCIVEIPLNVFVSHPRDLKDTMSRIGRDFQMLEQVANELVGRPCSLTFRNIKVNVKVNTLMNDTHACAQGRKKEEERMYIPEVVEIIHRKSNRGEFFTVKWKDNTSTTVKLAEGETSDEYTAFLYALGKKIFSDKGTARNFVRAKKKVFEDRMEQKSYEKQRKRKEQALRQSLEHEDIADISGMVYDEMFVAPCLVSRAVFKRNR